MNLLFRSRGVELMSNDPSQPAGDGRKPLFWGPDGRYYPPSEIGDIPDDELPGHLELPPAGRESRWLRPQDDQDGVMSLNPERGNEVSRELAEERRRAEELARLAERHRLRAEQLAAKLRELGIDPDQLGA